MKSLTPDKVYESDDFLILEKVGVEINDSTLWEMALGKRLPEWRIVESQPTLSRANQRADKINKESGFPTHVIKKEFVNV